MADLDAVEIKNRVFGKLLEKLEPNKIEPPSYPFRTIFASFLITFIHPLMMFFGTAFVIMMLWNLFLPTVGVATITYPVAIGVYLLVRLVIKKENGDQKSLYEGLVKTPLLTVSGFFIGSAMRLGFILGFGLFFHLFV